MFSTVAAAVCILVALVIGVVFAVFQVDRGDAEHYRALIASSDPQGAGEVPDDFTAKQQRKGVVKSVVYNADGSRLQLRMRAEQSVLVLESEGDGLEIVEKMQGVSCDVQEELYFALEDGRQAVMQKNGRLLVREGDRTDPSAWLDFGAQPTRPMQTVRHFDADSATYFYNHDFIEAEQVNLARFDAEGHALGESLHPVQQSLKGIADSVEMRVGGRDLEFRAHRLKAQIIDGGKLL